jgi:hypothetical protein
MSGKNWAATQGLRLRGGGKKRETSGQRPISEYELKLLKNIEDNKCERLALGLDTAAEQMRRAPKRPVQTSALWEVLDATLDAKRRLSPRLQMAPYTNGPSPNYLEHPDPPAQRHFATHLATTPPADNGDSDGEESTASPASEEEESTAGKGGDELGAERWLRAANRCAASSTSRCLVAGGCTREGHVVRTVYMDQSGGGAGPTDAERVKLKQLTAPITCGNTVHAISVVGYPRLASGHYNYEFVVGGGRFKSAHEDWSQITFTVVQGLMAQLEATRGRPHTRPSQLYSKLHRCAWPSLGPTSLPP